MGNDLAGGQVFPSPEVVNVPVTSELLSNPPVSVLHVFPACAVTRAQARKMGDVIDLSESFMSTLENVVPLSRLPTTETVASKCDKKI